MRNRGVSRTSLVVLAWLGFGCSAALVLSFGTIAVIVGGVMGWVLGVAGLAAGTFTAVAARKRLAEAAAIAQLEAPDPDDPRWANEDRGPQLAGRTCGPCAKKILFAGEALICETCGAPVHTKCLDRHVLEHAPTAGPFRG